MTTKCFAITGVTLSGNMGGSAMLLTTLQQLRQRFPGSRFRLFSIYPQQDKILATDADLEIVAAPPLKLLGLYMPLVTIGLTSKWVRRKLARYIPYFEALASADAVIDLSGIAFVDKRGLPLLWYNMSCALPGTMFDIPVFKLSQALGPFQTGVNRWLAKATLSRCTAVIARGKQSYAYLEGLGLERTQVLPDVSFAMEISAQNLAQAQAVYNSFGAGKAEWIIVSPSQVVNQLCERQGIDFLVEMHRFVTSLLNDTHANILILPHSLGQGKSKNNDVELCQNLAQRLADSSRVHLHVAQEDPALLRAIIGEADFFIGCRFHAVVAALSMGIPTLILGWSHKYAEMAASFEANVPSVDFANFSATKLAIEFAEIWPQRAATQARLAQTGKNVRQAAMRNFDIVEEILGSSHARR